MKRMLLLSLLLSSYTIIKAVDIWDIYQAATDSGLKDVALAAYPHLPGDKITNAKRLLRLIKIDPKDAPPTVEELKKGGDAALTKATQDVIRKHKGLLDKANIKVTGVPDYEK